MQKHALPLEARLISALLALLFIDPTPDPATNLFSIVDVVLFLFTKITRPAPAPDDGAGLKKATLLPTVCIVLVGICILYVYTNYLSAGFKQISSEGNMFPDIHLSLSSILIQLLNPRSSPI